MGLAASATGLAVSERGRATATGGAALIYTVASALLMLTVGPTRISQLPRRYLWVGGTLFVADQTGSFDVESHDTEQVLLVIVVASYRKTVYAYPGGGGAYAVAKDNFGQRTALVEREERELG